MKLIYWLVADAAYPRWALVVLLGCTALVTFAAALALFWSCVNRRDREDTQ